MATFSRSLFCVPMLCIACSSALSGCADLQDLSQFRSSAAGLHGELAAEAEAWQKRLDSTNPGDPARADVEAALARAKAKEAAAKAAIEQVDLVVERVSHPDDPLGQGIQLLSPYLPAPVQVPLALGAALVVSVLRGVQLKRGMSSIAAGLEKAMEEDGELRARVKANAATFRSIQTPAARKAVDRVQQTRRVRKAA